MWTVSYTHLLRSAVAKQQIDHNSISDIKCKFRHSHSPDLIWAYRLTRADKCSCDHDPCSRDKDVYKRQVSHMEDFLFWKECDFQNADMIFLPYHIASDESGNPLVSCDRERIVRNHAGFSWEGCVHEVLTHPNQSNLAQLRLNIPIIHCSAKTSYSDRNLLIYEKQIQSSKTLTLRDTFYYGRELFYHEKWEEAIHHLTVFLQSSGGWKENKIEACRILDVYKRQSGSFTSARACIASVKPPLLCRTAAITAQIPNSMIIP